jgi:hypothetical protein
MDWDVAMLRRNCKTELMPVFRTAVVATPHMDTAKMYAKPVGTQKEAPMTPP